MAWINKGFVIVCFGRMRPRRHHSHGRHFFDRDRNRQRAMDFHPSNLGNLTVLLDRPLDQPGRERPRDRPSPLLDYTPRKKQQARANIWTGS